MTRRSTAGALGLALILILLPATLAHSEYRGTDMWSNLAPPGSGGLADKYSLSYFTLDYYVEGPSVGVVVNASAGDIPGLVGQFLITFGFAVASFVMRLTVAAFDWAFNVDVIGGRHGILAPVGKATQRLWVSTFAPLLSTGVLLLGGWLVAKVVGRKFGEAGVGLVRTICLAAVALVIIFNPGATIGRASSLSNDVAGAIASASTGTNGGQDVSDRIFDTFIRKPWVVLEFGGLKHCVSSQNDSDGFPKPVSPGSASRVICRDSVRPDKNGYGGYAGRFLRYAPGSPERKATFEAIRDGEISLHIPSDPHACGQSHGVCPAVSADQFKGWKVDKADAPAVDLMQGAGTIQRGLYFILLLFGMVGAILFLGLICFAALFAQMGLMVLLAATPVVVIAAIIPSLNGIVFTWAKWMGKFLIAKMIYAVILTAALFVSAGLIEVGGEKGYLFVFFLQGCLFVGLFICRKALIAPTMLKRDYDKRESSVKNFAAGAATGAIAVAAAPVAAAGAAAAKGKSRLESIEQQHAKKPDAQTPADKPADGQATGVKRPDSSSPPATAGREYSPSLNSDGVDVRKIPVTSDEDQLRRWHGDSDQSEPEAQEKGDPMPTRSFREDYEQARAEAKPQPYGEQRKPPPVNPLQPDGAKPTPPAFAEHLEQERAKTPGS
jgi:hypothetical protein